MSRRVRSYSEDRLLDLIEQIYQASVDPTLWPTFLRSLADTLGAVSGNFAYTDAGSPHGRIGIAVNFDPQMQVDYDAYFGRIDPWAEAGRVAGLFRTGCVLPSQAVVPHDQLLHTEFYDGFGRRFGMARGLSGMINCEPSAIAAISLFMPESYEAYDEAEVALIRRLLPHLKRALDIHAHVSAVEARVGALSFSVERFACGVIFLDRRGGVLTLNGIARSLVDAHDGLSINDRTLEATNREDTLKIRRLVHGLDVDRHGAAAQSGGIVRLRRGSGKRPLVAVIAPLRPTPLQRELPDAPLQPGVVVFVHDPEREIGSHEQHLARLFALTPAEARVAWAMLKGDRIDEIADRLAVSINTVRTHLKRLFAKTDTRRQSELVRTLISATPPVDLG
jgi:DNA-binding CsgD family transcriptional regulator